MELLLPNIFFAFLGQTSFYAVFITALRDVLLLFLGILFLAFIGSAFRAIVVEGFGRASSGVINAATIPGVFIHESSHALAAILTGAKVTEFSIIPKGNSLGHICYQPSRNAFLGSIQNVVVGVAPAIVGFVGIIFILSFVLPHSIFTWQKVIAWYLLLCMLCHSEMSPADIPSISSIFILAIILFVFFLFVPINSEAIIQMIGFYPSMPT